MKSVNHILFIVLVATVFFAACKDRTPVIEFTPDNSSVMKENASSTGVASLKYLHLTFSMTTIRKVPNARKRLWRMIGLQ